MIPKCRMGLNTVIGCIQCGMASTGVSAPESEASGGFTKKLISCACWADWVNVAIKVPMPMPQSTQSAAPPSTSSKTSLKRHVEDDAYQRGREQHHDSRSRKKRRDLRDDDFACSGGRHQQLLDRAGFAFLDHRRGGDQRAVQNQQHAEHAGDDEPGRRPGPG